MPFCFCFGNISRLLFSALAVVFVLSSLEGGAFSGVAAVLLAASSFSFGKKKAKIPRCFAAACGLVCGNMSEIVKATRTIKGSTMDSRT
jgi:hypothetical protein